MKVVKKNTVIRNRHIILNTPALSDNTEDEVLIRPQYNLSDNKKIENHMEKNKSIVKLLYEWREDKDDNEQRETWEYLRQSLDEDRISGRKLFS